MFILVWFFNFRGTLAHFFTPQCFNKVTMNILDVQLWWKLIAVWQVGVWVENKSTKSTGGHSCEKLNAVT